MTDASNSATGRWIQSHEGNVPFLSYKLTGGGEVCIEPMMDELYCVGRYDHLRLLVGDKRHELELVEAIRIAGQWIEETEGRD